MAKSSSLILFFLFCPISTADPTKAILHMTIFHHIHCKILLHTLPDCRDSYGHFCGHLNENSEGDNSALQCFSVQESCNIFLDSGQHTCPTSCTDCPAWETSDPSTFWLFLAATSVTSPILGEYIIIGLRLHVTPTICPQLFNLYITIGW